LLATAFVQLAPLVDLKDGLDALLSLASPMKEQVLTTTASALAASGMTRMPAARRWPTMISESTKFLAQPSEMRLTVIIV
jgi:hypothetical protein